MPGSAIKLQNHPLAALLLLSCATARAHLPIVTSYPVASTRHTPGGVALDDPRMELDDALVDGAFAAVEACLAGKPRILGVGDTAMLGGMNCNTKTVPAQLDRSTLIVKVAPDWHVSACTGQQLFPCAGVGPGCTAKGLDGVACPCECRHAVQEHAGVYTLVVTPNLLLLRAAIVEAATGCANPWAGILKDCTH